MGGFPSELRCIIGNPVSDADFWPRHDIVDRLFRDLREGRGSRRLFGLRRIGKTSVLLELERRLRSETELTTIRLDVQGISRFKDFLAELFRHMPVAGRFGEARKKIATNPVMQSLLPALWARATGTTAPQPPSSFVNEFDHIAAWGGDIANALLDVGPIVLVIDELPFMLRNMIRDGYKRSDAERFLATLRSWRMNCGVRMLFVGSIGFAQLDRIDKVAVADHISDIVPVALPPLPHDAAIAMVEALAKGEAAENWSLAVSEAIVAASTETWPIFLQYGFEAVRQSGVRDADGIKAIIETHVRRDLDETFYTQFSTRLSRYQADEKAARAVLKTIVAAEPTTFRSIDEALMKIGTLERRDDLLEALREDDFIQFDTEAQTIRPASKLVPVWVKARSWGR